MAAILYLFAAIVLLALARRLVPLSLRAAAALVALPLVFTGSALLTGRVYAPVDLAYATEPLASMAGTVGVTHVANAAASDVYAQFVPWNAALRWAVAQHEWPLWNPFELGGDVLAAAAQSAPYHPFTIVALLLPQAQALTFAATMFFFFAGLTMFVLARDLEIGEAAALVAAAAWAFSMHVVAFVHTAHGSAVAMMPLVLLAAGRVARHPGVRSSALLTITLTLLLLCGHPETALHVVFLGSLFALFEMAPGRRAGDSSKRATSASPGRAIGYAAAAGIATLMLTAVFVLPMLDAIPQTREYLHRVSAGDSQGSAATFGQAVRVLPQNFLPFLEGQSSLETPYEASHPWAGSGYAGALAFAPALYALWRARGRRTWFFAGVVVFGWLIGAGTPGLAGLFSRLPLFSLAINARMIAFAPFGIALLAAIGIDAWLKSPRDGNDLAVAVAIVTIAILIGVAVVSPSLLASGLTPSFVRLGAMRALLPLLLAFALCRLVPSRSGVALGFLALLLLQRAGEAGRLQPVVDARAFYPPIAGLERLPRDEAQPYRIVGQGSMLTPDIAAHYRLEDVRGYQAMTFARLAATFPLWCQPQPVWSNRVDDLTAPMLSLMNVRYALANPHTPTPSGWQHIGDFPGLELLANPSALPRAFIPVVVHEGKWEDVVTEMSKCRDFGREAWIESSSPPATLANGSGRIAIRRRGSRLRLNVTMDAPGWVVVSEPAWRGWRAVDGERPLDLHFADSAFLAFRLGAGQHDVKLTYRPRSFVVGAGVSGASMLLLCGWGILRRRRV